MPWSFNLRGDDAVNAMVERGCFIKADPVGRDARTHMEHGTCSLDIHVPRPALRYHSIASLWSGSVVHASAIFGAV